MIERVRRHADDGIVPDDGAGLRQRQIILSDVHASGPESRARSARSFTMIVAPAARRVRRSRGRLQEVASGELLGPDLQQPGAAGQARRRVIDERPTGPGTDIRVADDVEMRWLKFQI